MTSSEFDERLQTSHRVSMTPTPSEAYEVGLYMAFLLSNWLAVGIVFSEATPGAVEGKESKKGPFLER